MICPKFTIYSRISQILQDVSDFSNEEFAATDWVNKIFADKSDSGQSKAAVVTSLVSKLQLYVQQVNEKIEDTSQEIFV